MYTFLPPHAPPHQPTHFLLYTQINLHTQYSSLFLCPIELRAWLGRERVLAPGLLAGTFRPEDIYPASFARTVHADNPWGIHGNDFFLIFIDAVLWGSCLCSPPIRGRFRYLLGDDNFGSQSNDVRGFFSTQIALWATECKHFLFVFTGNDRVFQRRDYLVTFWVTKKVREGNLFQH